MNDSPSLFAQLLGGLEPAAFTEQYLFKLPYAAAGGCRNWTDFGWSAVEQIWAKQGVDASLIRRGERLACEKLPLFAPAQAMFNDGYTLAVRNAQQHDARLQELAADFQRTFRAPVDIHVYCTPGSQFGFSWHFDAEEVFILHTSGAKVYSLRKNTVHPWPLVETMGPDLGYEHEIMPLMQCRLEAGDWLYIPAGYWHRGESVEHSISLAVGVMAPPALDVFDALRRRLLRSLRWRQRLPILGEASDLPRSSAYETYGDLLAELAADLQRELTSRSFLDDYLAQRGVDGPFASTAVQAEIVSATAPAQREV